jgi:mono/diheme cytochrome c family protein
MTGLRGALAVLAALRGWPPPPAAEVPRHRLADRALAVLRQRCAGCHGGATPHGKLSILDHPALTASDRKLIVPGDPDASTLLTRVKTGSMPPGSHAKLTSEQVQALQAWIAADAPPFSGNDYVLRHVLDDVGRLRDVRTARYLSLDHLLSRPDAVRELARRRSALAGVLQHFAGKKEDLLRPVDEAGLIFRIDLRDLGWQHRPLEIVGAPDDKKTSLLTYFDLLLLEYEFAALPADARLADELGEKFYEPSMPARQIAYLRGDWLAARALDPPLASELRQNTSDIQPPADVPRPDAEPNRSPAGKRVVPFDSVQPNPDDPSPFDLVVTTEQPGNTLRRGDRVAVSVENPTDKPVWVEAVHTDGKRRKTVLALPTRLAAGQKVRFPKEDGPVAGDGGRELVTLFVSPKQFDAGQVLRGDGLADRFVHPFYAPDDRGRPRNPDEDLSQMRVRTVALQVAEKK